MSARTPFVPADSRPDSQTAHAVKERTVSEKTRSQFLADSSNPLHSLPDSTAKPFVAAPHTAKESVVNSFTNEPLNTSSLIKSLKRNKPTNRGPDQSQNQTQSEKSHRLHDTPIRSGTADPFSKASQDQEQSQVSHSVDALDIISPIARRATLPPSIPFVCNVTPDVFTAASSPSGFRIPVLPGAQSSDKMLDQHRDAHISSSTLDFSYSNLQATIESQSSQLPTPPTSTRKGDAHITVPHGQLDSTLSKTAPPRRAILNPDGTRGPLIDEDFRHKTPFFPNKTTTTLKRYHAEVHSSDTGDYKRTRNDDSAYGKHAEPMTGQPPNPHNYSLDSLNSNLTSHSPYQYYANPLTPPNDLGHLHPQQNQQQPHVHEPSALDKLFGYDVGAYVDEHLEDYENSVQRWKQCTVDEWLAGAGEQAERFSKILDFVKDHMTTKMKLFATFDARVHEHSVTLTEREKSLGTVRERLVQESMNVLGTRRQQESHGLSLA